MTNNYFSIIVGMVAIAYTYLVTTDNIKYIFIVGGIIALVLGIIWNFNVFVSWCPEKCASCRECLARCGSSLRECLARCCSSCCECWKKCCSRCKKKKVENEKANDDPIDDQISSGSGAGLQRGNSAMRP